jgi:proline dehydrogenase
MLLHCPEPNLADEVFSYLPADDRPLPEETLEYLADRFLALEIQALTGATFQAYLVNAEQIEATAFLLIAGGGLCIRDGETYAVGNMF